MIKTIDSGTTGHTLAIFCGVHGNERAGILAVDKAIRKLEIKRGSVHFVYANTRAIEKGVRFTERNLNRCFNKENTGNTYEEKKGRELMKLLDKCDALLDIHSSNNPDTIPFIITDSGIEIAKKLCFDIVATGFDDVEPGGTDGYMKNNGKIGICIECGYSGESEKNKDLAYDSIIQFLQHFDAIEESRKQNDRTQKILHVGQVQIVTDETFKMERSFADFETIPKGTVIATDSSNKYVADKERVILFGTKGKQIGAEAYILGSWVINPQNSQ